MPQNNHQYKVGDKIIVNRKKNSNPCLEFSYALLEFFTNLVLVIILSHVFSHGIVINSQLFALPNVFLVGNMLDV